ncbi:10876_t:CDS:1, partial [Acaulospora colombiana]
KKDIPLGKSQKEKKSPQQLSQGQERGKGKLKASKIDLEVGDQKSSQRERSEG